MTHEKHITTIVLDDIETSEDRVAATSAEPAEHKDSSGQGHTGGAPLFGADELFVADGAEDKDVMDPDEALQSECWGCPCWHAIPALKRPYFVAAFIGLLFFVLLMMFLVNSRYVIDGLIPNILGLLCGFPVLYTFKYYESLYATLRGQFKLMSERNLELKDDLKKADIISIESKAKLATAIREKEDAEDELNIVMQQKIARTSHARLSSRSSMRFKTKSLLQSIREGHLQSSLRSAGREELAVMLPVVVSCIALLPFGMTQLRAKLKEILSALLQSDPFLNQEFHFFLFSYFHSFDVQRLFRYDEVMKRVRKSAMDLYGDQMTSMTTTVHLTAQKSMFRPDEMMNPHEMEDAIRRFSVKTQQDMASAAGGGGAPKKAKVVKKMDSSSVLVYSESDPVKLYKQLFDVEAVAGMRIVIPETNYGKFYDPINGSAFIAEIEVVKVFASKARPLLLNIYSASAVGKSKATTEPIPTDAGTAAVGERTLSPEPDTGAAMRRDLTHFDQVILKQGDDLRNDAAVLMMFRYMNEIWKDVKLFDYKVEALHYKCVPIGPDFGVIECVANVTDLKHIDKVADMYLTDSKKVNRLITSAAGSFIASYVMGIRDRHDENILVSKDSGALFHIDFGYLLGQKVGGIDTNAIAVTKKLYSVFQASERWNDFVMYSVNAWLKLRNHYQELIDFARVVFALIYPLDEVEAFIIDKLKLDMEHSDAIVFMQEKLMKSHKGYKTKLKNVVHHFAVKMKGT